MNRDHAVEIAKMAAEAFGVDWQAFDRVKREGLVSDLTRWLSERVCEYGDFN